ncbi:MAG: phospholipase D-like domain-containing protein [Actinocatenispora sp.]
MKVLAKSVLAVAAGVALLASGLAAPTPAAAAVTTQAVFNDPNGTTAQQNAIVTRIVELINGAAAGSRIRMSMYYVDDPAIPDALIAAHGRGVQVQVIVDHKETGIALWSGLTGALGTDKAATSYAITCPADRGCVGTKVMGGVNPINHNKFFLFSNTGGTTDVVVQSSANLHLGRDGTKGWNNALVLAGNDPLYQAYSGYFDDLAAMHGNANYYDTGRPPVTSGNAKIHFFPRAAASGADPYRDPTEDTIETVLDNVDCFGNTRVGTTDNHRTIIRVNQHIISRPYLATKLVALDKAGCYVEVVANYDPGNALAKESLNTLLAATSSGYNGVVVRYFCNADSVWTHSKYLEIEGKYYGGPDREIVWTGSANLSGNSLRQSDETILQFEDATVFDAYRTNFRAARDAAVHQPANGDPIACS